MPQPPEVSRLYQAGSQGGGRGRGDLLVKECLVLRPQIGWDLTHRHAFCRPPEGLTALGWGYVVLLLQRGHAASI